MEVNFCGRDHGRQFLRSISLEGPGQCCSGCVALAKSSDIVVVETNMRLFRPPLLQRGGSGVLWFVVLFAFQ